jgi:hypothetical protein
MYPECYPNGRDGKISYMKGCAACLYWNIFIPIIAVGAACTDDLVLSTSVCCKKQHVDTAKGIETSSQVITVENQPIYNAEDAHT